jgi:hypothetical protein
MFNDWIVQEDPPFGAWEWTIPAESLNWSVVCDFWTLAMETGIWGLDKAWSGVEAYLADAKEYFAATNILHFVSSSELARCLHKSEYWRGNQLTYYDEYGENLKTEWVEDAGELLRNLYPEAAAMNRHDMDLYPALRLWGAPVNTKAEWKREYTFVAELHSNIWFSELPCKPHWNLPEDNWEFRKIETIDNSLLAFENAQRLNTSIGAGCGRRNDVHSSEPKVLPIVY